MKYVLVISLVVMVVLVAGCKGGGQSQTQQPASEAAKPSDAPAQMEAAMFGMDIQPIFTNQCALSSCHGDAKSAGMQLSEGMAYANIVNVKSTEDPQLMRVMPGQPDDSYLVIKIEGRQKVGVRMPASGDLLSDKQVQTIRTWISAGAKND